MKKQIQRRCFLFLFLALMCSKALTAQDAVFSQFYASSLYLNPAFAGTSDGSRLTLNYRNHPFPDTGGFSTIYASLDSYVPSLYGGVGLIATSDNQGGLLMKKNVAAIYAYHLQLAHNLFINFGAQAGYYRQDLRWDKLEFANPGQPPPDHETVQSANFAAGVMVYNDRFYGGVSAYHLTQPKESFFTDDKLQLKLTAHMGFYLEPAKQRRANTLPFDYFISPNIIYQQQGAFTRVNLGLYGGVESIMAGAWFRHDLDNPNTLIFLVGLRFNNYRIGYSYDHSLSGYSDAFHAAHEISLTFEFMSPQQRYRQRIIRCPDF